MDTKIKTEDWIYFAGLFDGEGCVSSCSSNLLILSLANTNKEVIEWIFNIFGGSITKQTPSAEDNKKVCWHWWLRAEEAVHILQNILPFLKIKKRQAEIGIELQKTICYKRPLPNSVKQTREELRKKLRFLNKKGKKLIVELELQSCLNES